MNGTLYSLEPLAVIVLCKFLLFTFIKLLCKSPKSKAFVSWVCDKEQQWSLNIEKSNTKCNHLGHNVNKKEQLKYLKTDRTMF